MDFQTIEARKAQFPDRPLIRISSTFFWHLSSDNDLAAIPELAAKAHTRRADVVDLGETDVEEEVIYGTLKVGQQVQEYVCSLKQFLLFSNVDCDGQ